MPRLRVLVLTPDFPPARGGIQVLVERIVSGLASCDVHVVTAGRGATDEPASKPYEVTRVVELPGGNFATNLALNGRALAVARRWRPDVVLCAHIVLSPAAQLIRRTLGLPVVQYVYAKEMGARPGLARFALARADRTIVISRYTEELARGVGAPAARMRLIRPGVDLPDRVERWDPGHPLLLTTSRLQDRYKGHDVVLRALPLILARVPDLRWSVVGDGPLRRSLQELARALHVEDAVQFHGAVDDAERDRLLDGASAFVMPSRLPAGGYAGEGFGIVYLEAAAHGVPVVAANEAGARDAVVDGETGLLVDPRDHVAVADAITRIVTDPQVAQAMGAAGQAFAQRSAWPAVAAQVEALLIETAARRW